MDIAVTVSETARGLLISPVHTTDKPPNSCEVSWLVQCETLRYSHPPQKACFEDRNDHFMHYWHSVVLAGRGPALPCHHRLSLGSESRAGQSARVAGIAEVAARLLLRLAMGAPGCGRARPSSSPGLEVSQRGCWRRRLPLAVLSRSCWPGLQARGHRAVFRGCQ
jgi:hypothetical protein